MSDNRKQGYYDVGISVVKILLCFLMLFNTYVFIYYGLINKGDVIYYYAVREDNYIVKSNEVLEVKSDDYNSL